MPARPPAPSPRNGSDRPPADDAARWRDLALTLGLLLAESYSERAAEAERHAAEQAAERAAHRDSLLQDREHFLDLVAHELRTPVAVIKAYAELLEEQLSGQPVSNATRQVVATMLEQADLMTTLIEEVLDVQRLRLGKLPLEVSRVDLLQLARSVAREVQQTSRSHTIRVVGDPALPLLADRRRLRQVLTNLLENAVKYSAGGEIEVRVERRERNGQERALIAIRDQGVGIESGDLNRIFEPFEQVSGTPVQGRVGLGLGLFVARQIARAHGGDVWAESGGRGRGSTFYVELPLGTGREPLAAAD